jgi:hypothetical protein
MSNSRSEIADRLRAQFGAVPHHHIIHMPGEKPMRSANEIRIHLTLDEHFFQAVIPNPDRDVDRMVRSWDDFLAVAKEEYPENVRDNDRDTTKDILRDMLVEDQHLQAYIPDEPSNVPAIMAAGVLWMIFGPTNPIAEIVRIRRPKEAGYSITKLGPGHYNWRQVVA